MLWWCDSNVCNLDGNVIFKTRRLFLIDLYRVIQNGILLFAMCKQWDPIRRVNECILIDNIIL